MLGTSGLTLYKKPLVLIGPTSIGKTAVALSLAEQTGAVILSADSQLVYKGLDIGTAKPNAEEQARVAHHLIDLVTPTVAFSAADFKAAAVPLLQRFYEQQQAVIVVGGTGFYIRQLFETVTLPAVPPNPTLRQTLLAWAAEAGRPPDALYQRLFSQDPERAKALHPNNTQRILRALEIVESTGKPVPVLQWQPQAQQEQVCWVGLHPTERQWLWQRIASRVDAMLEAGWLNELQALQASYGPGAHALQVAHGYPELAAYARGELSLEAFREQVTIQVRQYSRRQWTWFSKNPSIHWLSVAEDTAPELLADEALTLWQQAVATD